MLARQADGFFVETLGVEVPPFDARDLSADQRRAVAEVLGTVLRPDFELAMVGRQSFQVQRTLLG